MIILSKGQFMLDKHECSHIFERKVLFEQSMQLNLFQNAIDLATSSHFYSPKEVYKWLKNERNYRTHGY